MKILIPVDGSEHTQRAVNFYLDHKQSFGKYGSVTLLHVRAPLPKMLVSSVKSEVIENYYAEEVDKSMSWARTRFAQYEATCQEKLELGDAADRIASIAESEKFDLIIMGSRGHGTLPGLAMGSTAMKVLASCKVPALIVR